MFVTNDLPVAIILCVITMIGWGSWANTQKLSGKEHWPFPLYYWDYAVGVFALAVTLSLTLGNGAGTANILNNLKRAELGALFHAFLSGVIFNIANILLVVAIDIAGMSVAFPVGIGLALVIGTISSYYQSPRGNPVLLMSGVALITLAMVLSAIAYRKLSESAAGRSTRGLVFAVVAGCLMGSFYPQLLRAITPNFNRASVTLGLLTPYSALLVFAGGLFVSNIFVNTIFMKSDCLNYATYFSGSVKLHSLGFLGGVIWMVALTCNVIASGVAGPAISYALGQGATLVAALWGVFIWKEFRDAPAGTWPYVYIMLVSYTSGLIVIGLATL